MEGQAVTYAHLAVRAGARSAGQATPQYWKEQYSAVRRAVARLAADVASARLDVLVVVGDDQLELFSFANCPRLATSYAERISRGRCTPAFAPHQSKASPPAAPLSQRFQGPGPEGSPM